MSFAGGVGRAPGIAAYRGQLAHFAGRGGGHVAFNATVGVVTVAATGGLLGIFRNPAGSGVDLYLARVVLTTAAAGRFERSRGGTVDVGAGNVVRPALNRAGVAVPIRGELWAPVVGTTVTGATLGRVDWLNGPEHYVDELDGSIVLPPGDVLSWMFVPNAGLSTSASLEAVWWYEAR